MERLSKIQILEETYNYYSDPSNRGMDVDGCRYITHEGKMCAVGRVCVNPQALESLLIGSLEYEDALDLDSYLKEEYQGHEKEFWIDLQGWHDNFNHFNDDSISEKGIKQYNHLVNQYKN